MLKGSCDWFAKNGKENQIRLDLFPTSFLVIHITSDRVEHFKIWGGELSEGLKIWEEGVTCDGHNLPPWLNEGVGAPKSPKSPKSLQIIIEGLLM